MFNVTGGAEGFDVVLGGDGFDRIQAGPWNDVVGLARLAGVEAIGRGAGTDTIRLTAGNDTLDLSATAVVASSSSTPGPATTWSRRALRLMLKGGLGNDTFIFAAGFGNVGDFRTGSASQPLADVVDLGVHYASFAEL